MIIYLNLKIRFQETLYKFLEVLHANWVKMFT